MSLHRPVAAKPQESAGVRGRMILLLAITLIAVTVAFYFVQRSLSSQVDLLVRERVSENDRVLRRVLELRADGVAVHADDYTRWDDFVGFARKPDPKWGQLYLTENIGTFGVDIAWVLDERFQLIFTANPGNDDALAPLPVPLSNLADALGRSPVRHFYVGTRKGVLEVWTSSIQPSSDIKRTVAPAGYYLAGRLWTDERIAELSTLLGGVASLRKADAPPAAPADPMVTGQISTSLPLEDIGGSPVAVLVHATTFPVAPRVHAALRVVMYLLMGGALVLFLGVSLSLTRWVAQPLALITESLRSEKPSLLYRLMTRHDEFGHLARLVRDFFAQRESLIEARRAAEAAASSKEQFLANISHELRTPMHGILSYSRFGVEEAETAERAELLDYFREISGCGTTLITLVDELLDLAKYDAGRMELDRVQLSLDEAAKEVAHELGALLSERGLVLSVEVEVGLAPVMADRMKIRQVFRNLISNAAKFTPAGGRLTISASTSGDAARVTVSDSGVGIPQEELESVFDRFSQASNRKSNTGGTGLGLPLCREIVKAHGGRIWAERGPQGGTRMIFEIPFGVPALPSAPNAPTSLSDEKPGREAA
ncbi:MAG TPA: ATP-binding protein [Candidatus Eisenbacteria bacterium]|nr:ATP-binding protein [Candidatus Eisenbacteria bacterium]